ncbi:MFS transporter [Paenibacillus xerothermodurans]|uniref:MFS transporter n=1 Tax=Paenibacillus xerothermodurans TaxID=1977292 RepID=A0A2W1NCW5_PAEXE|nr:MFS transporter [Paenibacillus xerothermodurans]PZE21774.1 MFS transporter [Paenibacillus xerothermodurans]
MVLRVVILIAFGFQVMINLTRPVITLYASGMGASALDIGVLTATYAFFPLIFAIHIGKIADMVGDRLPTLLGTIGMTIGVAFPFVFPAMWSLYVSQAIVGVSQIFINVSLQNVLGHAATKETRDYYFSMWGMSVALGSVIGPVLGGYLADHYSYSFAFLTASLAGVLPIAVSFFVPNAARQKAASNETVHQGSAFDLLKIPMLRKALASSALVLYSRDIYVAYFPLFASGLGYSTATIGWIITVQGVAMVTVRFFLARLSTRLGRGHVLMGSILLAGCAFLFMPFSGHAYVFALWSALMGAGLGCGQPLSMTTTYNASPKTRTGEVLGLRLACNRLSQMIAPLFFGLVGSWVGLVSVFYVSGLFLIGGAFLTRSTDKTDRPVETSM